MLRFILPALLALPALPAAAQNFDPSGRWYCTVNARSNDPAGNYGLEVEMLVTMDGQLQGRGNMFYPQLANAVQPMQGYGDWSVLPADATGGPLFKYRLHTQSHGIVTWYVRPTGPGAMYNMFRAQDPQTGRNAQVETQCGKTG